MCRHVQSTVARPARLECRTTLAAITAVPYLTSAYAKRLTDTSNDHRRWWANMVAGGDEFHVFASKRRAQSMPALLWDSDFQVSDTKAWNGWHLWRQPGAPRRRGCPSMGL